MDTEHSATSRFSIRIFAFVVRAAVHLPWFFLLGWMAASSWWLTDDAFISFRYARNLVDGHGLVFNPGERVEGYTNFLWTLELAGIWGLFGIKPEHSAPWLSVMFTAGTLAAVLYQVARMPSLRHRGLVAWMSMGLLCGSATFAVWTSAGGLETRQFTFFIVAAVVLLSVHRGSRLGLLSASFSLGLASLTRPEGLLIAGCCIGWFLLQSMASVPIRDIRESRGPSARVVAVLVQMLKRVDWREFACLALPFVVMAGAHFLFRFLYYGDLLPNTYHAKFVRPWWDMGLRYYAAAGLETGLYLLAPLAAAGAWLRWRTRRDSIHGLALLCVALHTVHVTRLGGDYFEWRVLDFYWPLLAAPAADAMARLGAGAACALGQILSVLRGFTRLASAACALAIFAPVLFYSSAMQTALLMRGAEVDTWHDAVNLKLDRREAGWLFAAPGMSRMYKTNEDLSAGLREHFVGVRFVWHRQASNGGVKKFQPYEGALHGKIPEDAVAVFSSIGVSGYHLPELKIVDYHGLADKTIARNPVMHSNDERRMAHDRVPSYGYLDQRGVNMRISPAERSEEEALAAAGYALQLDEDLWMPFDALDHQWVQARFGGLGLTTRYDRAEALDRAHDLLDGSEAVISSGRYDVHIVGDGAVYAKSPCMWDDVQHRFLLRFSPADGSDLPAELPPSGFYELDFNFWDLHIAADVEACVARVHLPGYDIAGVRTGQLALDGNATWVGAYSFAAAEAIDALLELRQQGRQPEIESEFDVFLDGGRLLYRKRLCSAEEIDARFFLHVFPADADDLPADRRESGFENLDFSLWQNGGRVGDECIAGARLPSYKIASVRTGQLALEGNELWNGAYSFAAAEVVEDVRELRRQGREPEIESEFDIFLGGSNLIYHKRPCSAEEIDARFFLHVFPADADDLPADRRESGFENLDFSLWQNGGRVGDECVAGVELPEYEISEIRTGQFTPDGRTWEASFKIENARSR